MNIFWPCYYAVFDVFFFSPKPPTHILAFSHPSVCVLRSQRVTAYIVL